MSKITAPGVVETDMENGTHREIMAGKDAEGRTVFLVGILVGEKLLMAHVEREEAA